MATIVDSKNLKGLKSFSSYSFNNDETKLILGNKTFKQVYRRSFKGTYYAYDIASKKIIIDRKKEFKNLLFSPDNKKVAYAKDNNLYIKNLQNNSVRQVTKDGKTNSIINGTTDWVYEEEFAFVRAYEWSNDSKFIAFFTF